MEEEGSELTALLATQLEILARVSAARAAAPTLTVSSEAEALLQQLPRYEAEARRVRAQMLDIQARVARMASTSQKLEARQQAVLLEEQRREESLRAKE